MKQRISIIGALLIIYISTGADTAGTAPPAVPEIQGTAQADTAAVCIKCYNDSINEIVNRIRNDADAFEKISRRIVRNTSNIHDNNTMIHGILNNCAGDTLRVRVVDTVRVRHSIHVQKKQP